MFSLYSISLVDFRDNEWATLPFKAEYKVKYECCREILRTVTNLYLVKSNTLFCTRLI